MNIAYMSAYASVVYRVFVNPVLCVALRRAEGFEGPNAVHNNIVKDIRARCWLDPGSPLRALREVILSS